MKICVSITFFLCCIFFNSYGATVLTDNFNDNSTGTIWKIGKYAEYCTESSFGLYEANQRLEFRAALPSSDSEGEAFYYSNQWWLDVNQDFSFKIDYRTSLTFTGDGAAVWLGITPSTENVEDTDVEILFCAMCAYGENYYCWIEDDNDNLTSRSTNSGILYISYTAATDKLYLSYIGYGAANAWKTFSGILKGQWSSAPVYIILGGAAFGNTTVSIGQFYLDNFVLDTGTMITPLAVPDVVGFSQDNAEIEITDIGLTIGTITTAYDDYIAAGNVISQSPAAGTNVMPGAAVNLVISLGKPYDGSGIEADPYQIATQDNLQALASRTVDYGKYFILTADIDLAGQTFTKAIIAPDTTTGDGFQGTPFTGSFDGNGHIISNLNITAAGSYYVGIFGYVGTGGRINNLGLEGVTVTGYKYVAGLCGYNASGTIEQCFVTGSVTGTNYYVGSLCGYNDYGTLNQCYSTATVTGGACTGGVLGDNYCGTISQCYAAGVVTGSSNVSGVCGYQYGTPAIIENCFWDTQTSGQTVGYRQSASYPGTIVNVLGKTTAQMQTVSTFTSAGWDFMDEMTNGTSDIWRMCMDGLDYPRFSWESTIGDFACPDGVNIEDLNYFVGQWLQTTCTADNNYCDGTDLDASGSVDLADIMLLAQHWLEN